MQPELKKVDSPHPHILVNLSKEESEIILQISHLYTSLEHIAIYDATNLTNSGKANIRRAQGQLQKLRLKVLDFFTERK